MRVRHAFRGNEFEGLEIRIPLWVIEEVPLSFIWAGLLSEPRHPREVPVVRLGFFFYRWPKHRTRC
jgi:hypothetical protein